MDPSPRSFPILSYVMSRIPSFGPAQPASDSEFDIEQPSPGASSSSSSAAVAPGILDQMPHLKDPKVLAAMRHAVADVAQTRSVLNALGPRPDHESVDRARAKLSEIESSLSKSLEDLVLTPRSSDVERLEWRAHLADKEERIRKEAEKERSIYKAVLQLDEMHQSYGKLLKEAEQRLARIYDSAEEGDVLEGGEIVNEEVVGVLKEALGKGLERMDLSGRKLKFLPEAFGKIKGLIVLDLSNNQLEVIPDSIAGLINLEEFNVSSNLLESLPDSIGLLQKMKILNVSGNKLGTLPDSICQCRSLVELNASFNSLTYLPTNIGSGLVNLERLSVELNKISSFPTSIGHMVFLRYLDAHFNELCGLPDSIGGLTNLEVLNLSSNFNDLTELPETFGELANLRELDLSNNQIHALPDTFGRLDNLVKLNLEQNPLVVPPKEIVDQGFEAVKTYMAKRWLDVLLEEEKKSMIEENEEAQSRWLTRSTSWLKNNSITLVRTLSGKMVVGGGSPRDPYLEEQR